MNLLGDGERRIGEEAEHLGVVDGEGLPGWRRRRRRRVV